MYFSPESSLVSTCGQRILSPFEHNFASCAQTLGSQHYLGGQSAIDFGQFRLRPAFFFDFGQFRLRPISTSANSISANFWMLNFWTMKVELPKGGGPEGGGPNPEKVGPRRVEPRRVEPRRVGSPKFRAFFFPPPATIFFLLSLSCGPFVEFRWCLKRRGPALCTLGVLGLPCASPGGPVWWGRRGFTQPESPNVHISGFRPSKTPTKFHERTPRERKKNANCGGRSEKKSEILGGPAEGCPPEGCPAEGCPAEGCPAEGGSPEGGSPEGGSSGGVHRQ